MARVVIATAILGLSAPQESGDNPIGRKLNAAVKEYKNETAKALKSAAEGLEKAEAAARRKGDESAITKLKKERKGLDEGKEFPASATAPIRKRMMTLQSKVEAAHQQAIRDYTKAGDDARAAETKKKLAELRAGFIGVVQIAAKKTYRIVNKNSGLAISVKSPQQPKAGRLIQSPVADDPHQLWTVAAFRQGEDNVFSFTNVGCGMAIGLSGLPQGAELVAGRRTPKCDGKRFRATADWRCVRFSAGF